jgi:cytochrome P450
MARNAADLDLPHIDLLDERTQLLHQVLAAQPTSWLARSEMGYVITTYDDATRVLRDQRWHQASRLIAQMQNVTDERFLSRQRESILSAEGETHSRLRRIVASAFTPKAADRYRPLMRDVVHELLDSVTETGRAELVADVCEPYPIPIICSLLGAPASDWKLFSRWATDLLSVFNGQLNEDMERILTARAEMDEYVEAMIDERRRLMAEGKAPHDLLTDLITAEESGDRLSTEELVMMAQAVLVAGTDTTRNQLGCCLAMLLDSPSQWDALVKAPTLAPKAVEESMRKLGAVRATARFASEDIEYRDVHFPEGTFLMISLAGANHDPAAFAEPMDLDVAAPRDHVHLGFGSGIHYCLGAALARAELQEALPILASRLPDLRVDGGIDWKPNRMGIWGAERMPLQFTPTPSGAR